MDATLTQADQERVLDERHTRHGVDCTPRVGRRIIPDNWGLSTEVLPSDWERAAFRIQSVNFAHRSMAVNLYVTGRELHYRAGQRMIRIKIEFVKDGDGEKSVLHGGWMYV